MQTIAVIGSRCFEDYAFLSEKLLQLEIAKIVSGGARGADQLGARYAREQGIELLKFLPDYKKHGRGATHVRNRQIVEASDMVVAFWDGQSRGTKYTMDYAAKKGKPVLIEKYIRD